MECWLLLYNQWMHWNRDVSLTCLTHKASINHKRQAALSSLDCVFSVLWRAAMDCCLACGTSCVTKGLRRTLHNPSVSHLVPVLRSFMSEFFNQEDVDHAVPHTPGTSSTSSYVCRKCFRSLESYVKAKNTLQVGVLNVGKKLLLSAKSDSHAQESTDQPGKNMYRSST